MFEKIVLRRSDTGLPLTLGEIAEALLFYQNVHLVLDPSSLGALIRSLGLRELLALIARKRFTAVYAEDFLVTRNYNEGSIPSHDFATATLSGKENEKPRAGRLARLELVLVSNGHSSGEARKLAERFVRHIPIKRYSSDYFTAGGIHRAATADLNDANYVTAAVRRVLQGQIGFESFAENLRIEVVQLLGGRFSTLSNIDFALGNERRKAANPALEAFTEGNLLVSLLDANADVNIASLYGGDFYTSEINSGIVQIRFAELLRRTEISNTQLQQFRDIALAEYPTIREVINSKERSFAEFEKLLDQSEKFRHSVHQMGPDANLVAQYFEEVRREGWISSLPGKSMRYVLGIGISAAAGAIDAAATGAAIGAAIGVAASSAVGAVWSAVDTFLLDKLKDWRPNHFVDKKLKPFLKPDN
jgi:hypothetical protein